MPTGEVHEVGGDIRCSITPVQDWRSDEPQYRYQFWMHRTYRYFHLPTWAPLDMIEEVVRGVIEEAFR